METKQDVIEYIFWMEDKIDNNGFYHGNLDADLLELRKMLIIKGEEEKVEKKEVKLEK